MNSVPPSIATTIIAEGGAVPFARFMELALTDRRAGYYTRPDLSLGPRGDFTTAPRRLPVFNRAVARMIAQLLDAMAEDREEEPGGGDHSRITVIEVGGGEGDLAAGVLSYWQEQRPDLRPLISYRIVEIGEGLRLSQRRAVHDLAARGWDIGWLDELPGRNEAGPGIVVSNEFLDALPVHIVSVREEQTRETWVRLDRREGSQTRVLREEWGGLSAAAEEEMLSLFGTTDADSLRPLSLDGILELRPGIRHFMRQAAQALSQGCVVTLDYGERLPNGRGPDETPAGNPRSGYLHGRTVRGYFRHQRMSNPYRLIGRQDLTADVDFRALEVHGDEAGLECVLFSTLAAFLRGVGGLEELERLQREAAYSLDRDMDATALSQLLDDAGLGGLYKVMLQVRE